MSITAQRITPCLWFDGQAEEAANVYVSIFDNARIGRVSYFGEVGQEVHGRKAGSVMTVEFALEGLKFVALNGGPHFTFNEAVSFQVHCETQEEIDFFWHRLTEGGQESQCGWLKDQFGLSWQVVPTVLPQMLMDADAARAQRVMAAFLQMKKFDIETLKRAYEARD